MTEFGAYIQQARDRFSWSLREAARQTKIPHSRLYELETGISTKTGKPVVPTQTNLENLARGYKLPLDHLFALAYFPEYLKKEGAMTGDELSLLDVFRSLNPDRRAFLLTMAQELTMIR